MDAEPPLPPREQGLWASSSYGSFRRRRTYAATVWRPKRRASSGVMRPSSA